MIKMFKSSIPIFFQLVILLSLVSCKPDKVLLSELPKHRIVEILSSHQMEEEFENSYVVDAGQRKISLKMNSDYSFEYFYEETYKGSRSKLVKITGTYDLIGSVKELKEKQSTYLSQIVLFKGNNDEFQLTGSLIQFLTDKGYKQELFFSHEITDDSQLKKLSSDNLKLPSKHIQL